jgi:hypothetical protein
MPSRFDYKKLEESSSSSTNTSVDSKYDQHNEKRYFILKKGEKNSTTYSPRN